MQRFICEFQADENAEDKPHGQPPRRVSTEDMREAIADRVGRWCRCVDTREKEVPGPPTGDRDEE